MVGKCLTIFQALIVSSASLTWWCRAAITPQNNYVKIIYFVTFGCHFAFWHHYFAVCIHFICAICSDFGFERVDIDSPCTPVRGYNPGAVPSNCSEGHTYTVSSG